MATRTIFNHGNRPLHVTICGTHHAIPAQAGVEFEAKLADEIMARAKADGVPFRLEPLPGALSAEVREILTAAATGRLVPLALVIEDLPAMKRDTLLKLAECVQFGRAVGTEAERARAWDGRWQAISPR